MKKKSYINKAARIGRKDKIQVKARNPHSVTLTISLVMIAGFIICGTSTYFSFQTLFAKDVEAVSELISENISINISSLMDRPISVSTTMAHDTFLRDFMKAETHKGLLMNNLTTMQQYLLAYQKKYQFDSIFFISKKTNYYYHYKKGIDRVLTPDNPDNDWYYDFLQDSLDCSLNIDNDKTKEDFITIFVNSKLYDENKNVLGVVGVGMETSYIQQFLLEKEQNFGVHAYLIDHAGNIQVSSNLREFEQVNLFENADFHAMASAIDTNTTDSNQRWYHSREKDGYVITRYISNLNWYLVVEKSTQEFKNKIIDQLYLSSIFILCIVLVVVLITIKIIKKYDSKLKNLAEIDQLTGIRNRTSYEREILKYAQDLGACKKFGIGICDLNNLKSINDSYGHLVGDNCIKEFSSKLCDTFKRCPVFRIGGDEFVIIYKDMEEETILEHWDRLSKELNEFKESRGNVSMSAAFGFFFWDPENFDTIYKIFNDADNKMYGNKKDFKRATEEL